MIEIIYTHIIFKLIISILLGSFLGIRHEMFAHSTKKHNGSFMGVRTATLICGLGAISTFIEQIPNLPLVFFICLFFLISIVYAYGSFILGKSGLTSELSAILIFLIGVLTGYGEPVLAIILTILLAAIDTFKERLHVFAAKLSEQEWLGAFQFLTISGAILPFLPQHPVDPWGVFVPFTFWLLVIIISGIGFFGYFFMKYLGTRAGIVLTGFLGSLVSSTAVTVSMAIQSKKIKLPGLFATGIFIAIATMQFRVVLEIFVLGGDIITYDFFIIPIIMGLIGILLTLYFFKNNQKHDIIGKKLDRTMAVQSPFELMSAIKFGLLFLVILFSLKFGKQYFGNSGVYIISVLAGITDVDPIVLSSLESLRLGEIELEVARNSIALAIITNTIMKAVYVYFLGSRKLLLKVGIGVFLVVLSSLIFFILL